MVETFTTFVREECISRDQGDNACNKIAYNTGTRIMDWGTSITHDFLKLDGVIYNEILLPEYVNKLFRDYDNFSNAVERSKGGKLFRECILSLPEHRDIYVEDWKKLIYRFIYKMKFIQDGHGVHVSIHRPHGGDPYCHVHLLVTVGHFGDDCDGLE